MVLAGLAPACVAPNVQQKTYSNEGAGFSRAALAEERRSSHRVVPDAANLPRVVWKGVATTVAWAELDARFPITASVGGGSAERVLMVLNEELRRHLSEPDFRPGGFQLVDAAKQQENDYALALLINKERWRQELLFDNNYRWEYSIFAQLVFIDQKKQEVCSSYPVALRVADTGPKEPTPEQIKTMVFSGLFGEAVDPRMDKSLLNSFLSAVQNRTLQVAPEYCYETLEVEVAPACAQPIILQAAAPSLPGNIGAVQYDATELVNFSGDVGTVFVNHLGNDSDLPVHPYLATQRGRDNILALSFLNGARIQNGENKLSLRLRPPARQIRITIDRLNCEVDPDWSGKYAVNILFGFAGHLEVIEPVTQRKVLEHHFDLSLAGIQELPKALRETYWQAARRKVLPEQFAKGNYDQKWCWSNAMDAFLDQLTTEMLFSKADRSGRFRAFREDLGRMHPALSGL